MKTMDEWKQENESREVDLCRANVHFPGVISWIIVTPVYCIFIYIFETHDKNTIIIIVCCID